MNDRDIDDLAHALLKAVDTESGAPIRYENDVMVSGRLMERFTELALGKGVEVSGHTKSFPGDKYYGVFIKSGGEDKKYFLSAALPHPDLATQFNMSASEYADFSRKIFLLDYEKLTTAMQPLVAEMSGGKDVHIIGRETDLTFRLEDISAWGVAGVYNLPDGECFSAPVKESVNGHILYGPSNYWGEAFEFMKMRFRNGKVVEAEAENRERTKTLNKMLDVDRGARYAGEFALGLNPYIEEHVGEILFDEKMWGTVHIALGHCLKEFAPNENTKSRMHWDMVHNQRAEFGGGELWFDDKLIRRNGLFVPENLQGLNPENLIPVIGPR